MLTISCRYRVHIGTLSYLVYIVEIAMLTISCRYRVDIGILLYLVYIVNIVDIAMSTISCRYRVDIVTLSYFVYIVYVVKSKVYNCFIKSAKILHDIDHNKCPWPCPPQLKVGAKWCAYIVTSQEHAHKTRRSKQNLIRKPAFLFWRHGDDKLLHSEVRKRTSWPTTNKTKKAKIPIHFINRDVDNMDDINTIIHQCERCWHDIVYTSFTSQCRQCRRCKQYSTSM